MIANPSYQQGPNVPNPGIAPTALINAEDVKYVAAIKRITWAAIFAGVVIALVVQILFSMLGTGIGVSTVDPMQHQTPDPEVLALSAAVWLFLSSFIALFTGGWIAGRLAGIPHAVDGMIHGLLTWGLSTLLALYLVGSSVGSMIGGALKFIGGGIAAVAPEIAGAVVPDPDASWRNIKEEVRELLRQSGKPALQPEALAENAGEVQQRAENAASGGMSDQEFESLLKRLIQQGKATASEVDREALTNVLVARSGMTRDEATRTIDFWTSTYHRALSQAEPQAREVADATAKAIASASIWGFLALLIGAAAAGCGGVIGAPRTLVEARPVPLA